MTGLTRRLAGSALAGAASGARSLTGLAALTVAARPGAASQPDRVLARTWVKATTAVLGAQEYALDKLPNGPSRLALPGLASRLAGSAASGIIIARRAPDAVSSPVETVACAGAGVGAAVASAWLGLWWRTWAGSQFGSDWIGAVLEDVATLTLAAGAVALADGARAPVARPAADG